MKSAAPQIAASSARRPLAYTLGLFAVAGLFSVLTPAPEASANGFHKGKSFHSSGFKHRSFAKKSFSRRFHRPFRRSFDRGHISRRNTFFHRGFDHHHIHGHRFHGSTNFSRSRSGFGLDGPVTFRNSRAVTGTNFVDRSFDANAGAQVFTPRGTVTQAPLDPEYRISPLRDNDAWALLDSGMYNQALIAFGRLATAAPHDPVHKVGFGLSAAATGMYDRAERAFDRAGQLLPNGWDRQDERPGAGALARDLLSQDQDLPESVAVALRLISEGHTPGSDYAEPAETP